MTELQKIDTKDLDEVDIFYWRSKAGEVDVHDMETSHLYNTLKMIWNHCVTEKLQWDFSRHYHFSSVKYNKDYMRLAVAVISKELMGRDDIEKCHLNFILYIKKNLNGLKRIDK